MQEDKRFTQLGQLNSARQPLNGLQPIDQSSIPDYTTIVVKPQKPNVEAENLKVEVKIQEKPTAPTATYKSYWQVFGMVSIVSINSLLFGYLFTVIATLSTNQLITIYGITFNQNLAVGLIQGTFPLGGVAGALIFPYYIKIITRRFGIYPSSSIAVIGTALAMIPTVQTLFIGRFVSGICAGLLTGLTPLLLKDLAPKELRSVFGSFNNLARIIGIVLCYGIGLLVQSFFPSYGYQISIGFSVVVVAVQMITVYYFIPESPGQMAMKKNNVQLQKSIRFIYKEQFVQKIMQQYINEFQFQVNRTQMTDDKKFTAYVDYTPNKRRAYFVAVNIAVMRQFCGINNLILYAGTTMLTINPQLAVFTPLLLNVIQLIAGILGTIFLVNTLGRRFLIVFGLAVMGLFNIAIGIGCFYSNSIVVLVFMIVSMITFATTFNPPSWSYPIQIIPAAEIASTTVTNWVTMVIVTVLPPIVQGANGGNSYPTFFFFGGCCFAAVLHLYFYAIEIKGLTYQQIVPKF